MVDRNGNVVNNYQYDEWGNILVSNETVSNPFKYAGEVYDQETGLYYLRARYYDPKLGRFLNEDSNEGQVNNPLTSNLYTYCVNNPCLYVDRSGHAPMIYDAGDYYLFSPDDAMFNTVCAAYGYIPFVGGWIKDQLAKACGFPL